MGQMGNLLAPGSRPSIRRLTERQPQGHLSSTDPEVRVEQKQAGVPSNWDVGSVTTSLSDKASLTMLHVRNMGGKKGDDTKHAARELLAAGL